MWARPGRCTTQRDGHIEQSPTRCYEALELAEALGVRRAGERDLVRRQIEQRSRTLDQDLRACALAMAQLHEAEAPGSVLARVSPHALDNPDPLDTPEALLPTGLYYRTRPGRASGT